MKKQQTVHPYILQRMRRKSLKLSITPEAEVLVQAPMRLPRAAIDQFVTKHADWIAQHLRMTREQQQKRSQALGCVRFLGKDYGVYTWGEKEVCLQGDKLYLPQTEDAEKQRRKVIGWYRSQAQALLERRTAHWAGIMGCSYNKLRISSARKRWGSCTSEKTLSFAWRLMLAPPKAIDYVIIHELTHLSVMDHSQAFWELVAQYCPDYAERKQLLAQTSEWMQKEGWDI